jgi:dihydrofolate reductase
MTISIIAAIGLNRELGYNNKLLCHLPNDLKYFKKLTIAQFVVMGRKTYESIGHCLPNRHNIVLSRDITYNVPDGAYVYNSLDDVINEYKSYNNNENELFIIGGADIYRQALPKANKIYLTIIDHKFENVDAYFPPFSLDEWEVTENIKNVVDEKNPYDHYFVTYKRRNNIK